MRTAKIKYLQNKAIKEAQKEVDKVFNKYSILINKEIASQIPEGFTLVSWNGMCELQDENGNTISKGNAWSRSIYNQFDKQLDYISDLQYSENIEGCFDLEEIIKGAKNEKEKYLTNRI